MGGGDEACDDDGAAVGPTREVDVGARARGVGEREREREGDEVLVEAWGWRARSSAGCDGAELMGETRRTWTGTAGLRSAGSEDGVESASEPSASGEEGEGRRRGAANEGERGLVPCAVLEEAGRREGEGADCARKGVSGEPTRRTRRRRERTSSSLSSCMA